MLVLVVMKTYNKARTVRQAMLALGPVSDEPTEEQFEAYRTWANRQELGPASSMAVYEEAILLLRRQSYIGTMLSCSTELYK